MNTAKKIYEADEDGIVHVAFPTGRPGVKIEVLVVWDEPSTDPAAPGEDWSDFFGMLKDAPLERPPQGELEQRDEFK